LVDDAGTGISNIRAQLSKLQDGNKPPNIRIGYETSGENF